MTDSATQLKLRINGEDRLVVFPTHHTLLEVLREECGLTGTKHGCELGECGTCAVLVDGRPVLSCLALAADMAGHEITTVEGLSGPHDGYSAMQEGFRQCHGLQCGFCTPGMLMAATGLLAERGPDITEREIREGLEGNLCRCTGYEMIVRSVRWAAEHLEPDES